MDTKVMIDALRNGQISTDELYVYAKELEAVASIFARKREVIQLDKEEAFSKISAGWYAYEGGKFSNHPDVFPNCQGVVGWVNLDKNAPVGQRGLIMLPEVPTLLWSDIPCEIGVTSFYKGGRFNTEKLLAYGREHNIRFPAAEWCASYCKNGIKPGEVFLPGVDEMIGLFGISIDYVNTALRLLGGSARCGGFTSVGCDKDSVYAVTTHSIARYDVQKVYYELYPKLLELPVVGVLAF